MPKVFTSKSQKKGEVGEEIAKTFLMKQGFEVIERNYTRKWGEIDIVAVKASKIRFIEVKSVSCVTLPNKSPSREENRIVSYETNRIRPEDNLHPKKLERLYRTIETYLAHRNVPEDIEWQLDLVCVYLDDVRRVAKVKMIENITG
jgi:putative endonuclease